MHEAPRVRSLCTASGACTEAAYRRTETRFCWSVRRGPASPTWSCGFCPAALNWWRTIRWTSSAVLLPAGRTGWVAGSPRPGHRAPALPRPGAAGACRRTGRTRRPDADAGPPSRLVVPVVRIDAAAASAPERVALALDCAAGRVTPGCGSVRGMSSHERRDRHRPVRRRQGLDSAGAGGCRLRSGRQSAADHAGGDDRPRRAGSSWRSASMPAPAASTPRLCWTPSRRLRANPALRSNWSMPGPTKAPCCAATPKPAAAIRWHRKGWCADGIAAEIALTEPLREEADWWSIPPDLPIANLRRLIERHFGAGCRSGPDGGVADVVCLPQGPAAGSRSGIRCTLPAEPALRSHIAAKDGAGP